MAMTRRKLDRLKPVPTFRTPEQHRNIIQPKKSFTAWQELPSHPTVPTMTKAEKNRRKRDRRKARRDAAIKVVVTRSTKDAFYESWEWKHKRLEAIKLHGRKCLCCGAGPEHGVRIVVDHIKPLGEFWELRLDLNNLQVLCNDCNMGKGNRDFTDFRPSQAEEETECEDAMTAEYRAMMRDQ